MYDENTTIFRLKCFNIQNIFITKQGNTKNNYLLNPSFQFIQDDQVEKIRLEEC